jgi:hypothetical protein
VTGEKIKKSVHKKNKKDSKYWICLLHATKPFPQKDKAYFATPNSLFRTSSPLLSVMALAASALMPLNRKFSFSHTQPFLFSLFPNSVLSLQILTLTKVVKFYACKGIPNANRWNKVSSRTSHSINFSLLFEKRGIGFRNGIVAVAAAASPSPVNEDISQKETPQRIYTWPDNKVKVSILLSFFFRFANFLMFGHWVCESVKFKSLDFSLMVKRSSPFCKVCCFFNILAVPMVLFLMGLFAFDCLGSRIV